MQLTKKFYNLKGSYICCINVTNVKWFCTCEGFQSITQMWPSRVDIEGCSAACFDCIAALKVLHRLVFINGGAHMGYVDSPAFIYIWSVCASPVLNKHSVIRCFEWAIAIIICSGIIFGFCADYHIYCHGILYTKIITFYRPMFIWIIWSTLDIII